MTINRRELVTGAAMTAGAAAIPASAASADVPRQPVPQQSFRYPFFGISADTDHYATAISPAIAINSIRQVVSLYRDDHDNLYGRAGEVSGTTLRWRAQGSKFDTGRNPSVALIGSAVVEVHDSGGVSPNCFWRLGEIVVDGTIKWSGQAQKYDGGRDPTVAVSEAGVVVEIHNSEISDRLFSSVGVVSGKGSTVEFSKAQNFDTGFNPSVAINKDGVVVEVHDDGLFSLWYSVGQVKGQTIDWAAAVKYDTGISPSVALTDEGFVFEVHQSQFDATVWQRCGRIVHGEIVWIDVFGNGRTSEYFDDGKSPCIASNGQQAVQAHQADHFEDLYANACLVIDRANWMATHRGLLGPRTLSKIAMPACHDAGMYLGGISLSTFGKTQDLDIYGQLCAGSRYFDLRPKYENDGFVLYHGDDGDGVLSTYVAGAKLSDVLDLVAKFMKDKQEIVLLKFSHYRGFELKDRVKYQNIHNKLCDVIRTKIGNWLFSESMDGERLAQIPLSNYLRAHGTVLVVCDTSVDLPPFSGIYRYRDWYAANPAAAQLTVFDVYSDTIDLEKMAYGETPDAHQKDLPVGQLPKFKGFKGTCRYDAKVPCDLFLLSWTLTPDPTGVWPFARLADKSLVDHVEAFFEEGIRNGTSPNLGRNAAERMINLIYVDYVQYSRALDFAFVLNNLA